MEPTAADQKLINQESQKVFDELKEGLDDK
jgi:hypothetical protein